MEAIPWWKIDSSHLVVLRSTVITSTVCLTAPRPVSKVRREKEWFWWWPPVGSSYLGIVKLTCGLPLPPTLLLLHRGPVDDLGGGTGDEGQVRRRRRRMEEEEEEAHGSMFK